MYLPTGLSPVLMNFLHPLSGTPLGHLPILEVDGKTICGSTGIARFLAERFGE